MHQNQDLIQSNRFFIIRTFDKYFEIFKISYKNALAYFLEAFSRTIDLTIRLIIFNQLYIVTYRSQNTSLINDLARNEVLWILMFVQSFHLSQALLKDIIANIQSGQITVYLNKPFYFPLFQLAEFVGTEGIRVIMNLFLGSVITFLSVGGFNFNTFHVIYAFPLAIGTLILGFLQVFIFALFAFWMEDSSSLFRIYSKIDIVLGGSVFPPALFPKVLKQITVLLPFANGAYIVGKTIVKFERNEYFLALKLQFLWILLFLCLIVILYRKGTKKLVLQGG